MILIYLLVLFVVNTDSATEGDSCSKKGVPGVCTNIRVCPDAQQDIAARQLPTLCDFTHEDPIVCCISNGTVVNNNRAPKAKCVVPPHPEHGSYITNVPDSKPGDTYDFLAVNVTCQEGYLVDGSRSIFCQKGHGWWPEETPKCISACRLSPHPSIEYDCFNSDDDGNSPRPCNQYEPSGTVITPRCRAPEYNSPAPLRSMNCVDGVWNYFPKCISGAHHFYTTTDKKLPASNFVVAVGKLYRPWNYPMDESYVQQSDVKEIHLPVRYLGSEANFQEDIAIVEVSQPFEMKWHIRPVCLDFDFNFDRRQLEPGNKAKVAGWGLTGENGPPSQVLKIFDVPYQSIETCLHEWPQSFLAYVTADKICAGTTDGTITMCKGDSGGGLAFPETDKGKLRYYLRGVMSTAPRADGDLQCNVRTYTAFTHVIKHEQFINQFYETS